MFVIMENIMKRPVCVCVRVCVCACKTVYMIVFFVLERNIMKMFIAL
jgi:hypothetical protein